MPTTLTCTKCQHTYTRSVTLEGVDFRNNRTNVMMPCPKCGHSFDGAPGDGVWSTGHDGRLRRVVDYLAKADLNELRELRAELENLRATGDAQGAERAITRLSGAPASQWTNWSGPVIGLLGILITVVIFLIQQQQSGEQPTKSQIDEIIRIEREQLRELQSANDDVPQAPRNAPCPCGSKKKYKRCHGAPPTSSWFPRSDQR
ncbi:SEC-C metal-binding domain-containing protein [Nocardioides scoriae]|uniref:SEC-C metal-binding domain-containing protein n=1 Tax=Nocardioides scoriae TaxID=642780 RepID=UPI0012F942F9|nr:SEC-C metal-binding domain-containing protein [Nocardioides scoriae]